MRMVKREERNGDIDKLSKACAIDTYKCFSTNDENISLKENK